MGFNRLEVPESRVVVIEGIYALSERLKPLLDLRVSITGELSWLLVGWLGGWLGGWCRELDCVSTCCLLVARVG